MIPPPLLKDLSAVIMCALFPTIVVSSSEVISSSFDSMTGFRISWFSDTIFSNVFPSVDLTVKDIAGLNAPVFGPTATMSGASGSASSNSCINQPSGTLNLMLCSTLSNFGSSFDMGIGALTR